MIAFATVMSALVLSACGVCPTSASCGSGQKVDVCVDPATQVAFYKTADGHTFQCKSSSDCDEAARSARSWCAQEASTGALEPEPAAEATVPTLAPGSDEMDGALFTATNAVRVSDAPLITQGHAPAVAQRR
jgi:hypothetical protein